MVNKFLYPRGGAETYMLKIGEYLQQLGHEIQYFGMYDDQNTVGNQSGLYTTNMDFHSKGIDRFVYPFRIIYSKESYEKISKVIDEFDPDVIHMNNINFQLTPSIIEAAKHKGVRVVQTVHDYQMVCPNHLLYIPSEKRICEECVGHSSKFCTEHKCIHNSLVKSMLGSIEAGFYKIRGTYSMVDKYICPSEFLKSKLVKGADFYAGKAIKLTNYIELPDLELIRNYRNSLNISGKYAAFAGRISEEKGVKVFAEAARLLPDVQFYIAGAKPDDSFDELLSGSPNLHYIGFISGMELQSFIYNAAMVAVPSVWFENCPLTILESCSLGTPVISVNMGGMAELIKDGITGKLIEHADGRELAAAVSSLINDDVKLEEMRRNCLELRDDMITIDRYCRYLEDIYAGKL